MSFRALVNEMAANDKHPFWGLVRETDPDQRRAPLRKAIGISSDWAKEFWERHRAALSAASPFKRGEYAEMIKAIRQDQAETKAEMRKSESIYAHQQLVLKHAILGQKITDACRRGTLSALEGATLETRWNAHGAQLDAQAKRLGLRK